MVKCSPTVSVFRRIKTHCKDELTHVYKKMMVLCVVCMDEQVRERVSERKGLRPTDTRSVPPLELVILPEANKLIHSFSILSLGSSSILPSRSQCMTRRQSMNSSRFMLARFVLLIFR